MNTTADAILYWNKYADKTDGEVYQTDALIPDQSHLLKNRIHPIGFFLSLSIFCGISSVLAATLLNWHQIQTVRTILLSNTWTHALIWMFGVFMIVNMAALIWRIVLFRQYHSLPDCDEEKLPRCTVIVPAYNEGKQVLTTLQSIAKSDYPKDKLQIIAIDDGSQDDTWQWIVRAKYLLKGRITTYKQPENRGKRHALHRGISNSTGDILVTIDSDSTIHSKTLRRLVSPFVLNPKVGAVAGNVRVLNQDQGIIPKMLDIIFVYSFDFIRASQSMVNTVMCTPGALSAYRKKSVMPVLEEWLHQSFCGRQAKIGEDRAMTNLILREGYSVLFQQNAKVYTNVPTRYTNLCKMLLRWARSNIRETLVMSRFAFRRFRNEAMLGARINLLLSWLTLVKSPIFLCLTWALILWQPLIIGLNVMFGLVISATILAGLYAYRYRSTNALLAFVYQVFWFTSLFWIAPYAMITPHRSEWLTRDLKNKPESKIDVYLQPENTIGYATPAHNVVFFNDLTRK